MDAEKLPPSASVETPLREEDARALRPRVYFFLTRAAYWTPVFAALLLFALVSFKGLRPALSEAGRLADAEEVLTARHARALERNREIKLQLVAREDPVFRERQRRLRTIAPANSSSTATAAPAKTAEK